MARAYILLCVLGSGASLPHAQTVGFVFPCCEPCSLVTLWGCHPPHVFVGCGVQLCLGHCVFVVSHFLLWSVFEFPMTMLGVLFLIHCGLWIVASFIEGLWLMMYPRFGCCYWVVLATLGPRTTLSCLVVWSCVSSLVWNCPWFPLPSSQSCEWVVLLRCAVVGLRTVVSKTRG